MLGGGTKRPGRVLAGGSKVFWIMHLFNLLEMLTAEVTPDCPQAMVSVRYNRVLLEILDEDSLGVAVY